MICLPWGNGVNVQLPILVFQPLSMQAINCQNCNHLLSETYQFCPDCGQTVHIHKFSVGHLFHEFFHAFTHTDKGILFLVKELAVRPGIVLKEYILKGKRKKYFNPFTFLLLVLGLSVLVNGLVHPFEIDAKIDPKIMTQIKTPEKQAKYLRMIKKRTNMNNFFEKQSNWVALLSTPVISFVFWLMFKRRGLTFAEHFVAFVLLIGFMILLTTLTLTPLMSLLKGTKYYYFIVLANLIFQLIYFSWGYKGFLNLQCASQLMRVTFTSFLAIMLWLLVSSTAVFVYLLFF